MDKIFIFDKSFDKFEIFINFFLIRNVIVKIVVIIKKKSIF